MERHTDHNWCIDDNEVMSRRTSMEQVINADQHARKIHKNSEKCIHLLMYKLRDPDSSLRKQLLTREKEGAFSVNVKPMKIMSIVKYFRYWLRKDVEDINHILKGKIYFNKFKVEMKDNGSAFKIQW